MSLEVIAVLHRHAAGLRCGRGGGDLGSLSLHCCRSRWWLSFDGWM